MTFTTTYRNGKPQYFFIKIDNPKEFNFIKPYFILTSSDKPRFGNILEMNCLFACSVWQGRQKHGYGYSCSHDVYSSLINAITKLHGENLTQASKQELSSINTHNDVIALSDNLLKELEFFNTITAERRY